MTIRVNVTARLRPDVRLALEKVASRERRTLSQVVALILEDWAAKQERREKKSG